MIRRHLRPLLLASLLGLAGAGPPNAFHAGIHPLPAAQRDRMVGRSWHDGCPVPLDDLVAIDMTSLGLDRAVHPGTPVVYHKLANPTVAIFHALFDAGFRIERMQPYEDFPVGEYAAHDDTVGFSCRPAQDNPGSFSWHAYGLAVDINPLVNSYHDPKEGWWPAGSAANASRDRTAPGLLSPHSPAVRAFMEPGRAWGGIDGKAPEYMHFSKVAIGDECNPMDRPVWADRLVFAPD